MILSEKAKRLQMAYKHLYSKGTVKSVKHLAELLDRARPGVNNALNGKENFLNDAFLSHFVNTFPQFSLDWLMTGKGKMIKEEDTEQVAPIDQQADALMFAVDQIGKMAVKATEALARIEAYEARLTAALERVESYEAKMQQMMSTNFIIATPSSRKTHASTTPDVEKIIAGARMLYQKEKKPRKRKITIPIQNSTHDVAAEDVPK